MKNPQSVSSRFHALADEPSTLLDGARLDGRAVSRLTALRLAELDVLTAHQGLPLLKNGDKEEPSTLAGVLAFLKYTPDEIARIEKFVGTVGKLASTVSWVIGAVTTIKDVLTLVGVLEKDDEAAKLQKDIAAKVDTIYRYLQDTERRREFELTVGWRGKVQETITSISNFGLSRSQNNLDDLRSASTWLMTEALAAMLDPQMGEIPFRRKVYGGHPSPHTYLNQTPEHWTEYAFPSWMQTTKGDPVALGAALDLGATIWDPGYYLDVLIEAVGARLAALAALEPAFRSTGYDRDDLRAIHRGLTAFVARWEQSLFKTIVVGPLDPQPDPFGDHRIHHPWLSVSEQLPSAWTAVGQQPALPLGAVDPVSGVTAFDPFWREGLLLHFNGVANYWVVRNYDAAVATAYARQSGMLALVRDQCGLRRVRDLRDAVYALIGPPSGSEFATPTDAAFTREDIAGAAGAGAATVTFAGAVEEVDLGVLGNFIGKSGKKYPAKRGFQHGVKRFRVPMARRMDASKIQLGYRLRFVVGGDPAVFGPPAIDVTSVLSEYSAAAFPEEVLPLFPTTPQVHELRSEHAAVYDVIQSDVFSAKEEDAFEATGAVPGKTRLYLNRRTGKVAARVKVDFEFDARHPDHRFVGFANVTIGTLDPNVNRDGFVLSMTILEKCVAALTDPPRDEVREDTVAMVNLHFAPSFLVVGREYFDDRQAGFAALEQAVDSIEDRYRLAKLRLGPLEPITRIQRAAEEQELVVNAYNEVAARSPELARQLSDRFAMPAVRPG